MAFLDKLKETGAAVVEKSSDTVAITKLKSKIVTENKEINENYTKIGQMIFEKFTAADVEIPEQVKEFLPEEAQKMFDAIKVCQTKIADLEQEIENVKND